MGLKYPIGQSDFARLIGCRSQNINIAMKKGALKGAKVRGTKQINLFSPAAIAYVNQRGLLETVRAKAYQVGKGEEFEELVKHLPEPGTRRVMFTKPDGTPLDPSPMPAPRTAAPTPPPPPTSAPKATGAPMSEPVQSDDDSGPEIPDDIREFANYTLKQIIKDYGSDVRFLDWLNATKKIEDIHEKRLRNAKVEGEVIPRSFVASSVYGLVEQVNLRLLHDAPKTLAVRSMELTNAGEPIEHVEDICREIISSQIKNLKDRLIRELKTA